jgi:ribosomal 50S subunit-recycling heat shock protein
LRLLRQGGDDTVRLDKFLKVSRLVKRRTIAKEVAAAERILINGRLAKPATEVKPGDRLELHLGGRLLSVEVLAVSDHVPASQAASLYRILEDRPVSTLDS